jgi:uncharacterized membrane protein (DUF485 family)
LQAHPGQRQSKKTSQEKNMIDPLVAKIEANPKYHELRRKRNSFGWMLTIIMMVVYYGYIALIAFNKPFLAQPIGAGVTTMGVPIGMGVIVFTIVITGIYVRRANSEFDRLTAEILKEASK